MIKYNKVSKWQLCAHLGGPGPHLQNNNTPHRSWPPRQVTQHAIVNEPFQTKPGKHSLWSCTNVPCSYVSQGYSENGPLPSVSVFEANCSFILSILVTSYIKFWPTTSTAQHSDKKLWSHGCTEAFWCMWEAIHMTQTSIFVSPDKNGLCHFSFW